MKDWNREDYSWAIMLEEERDARQDTSPMVGCTLSAEAMSQVWDNPAEAGVPFTAWSEQRVYFPAGYDGFEWVDSVPRHPCDESTDHVGEL